MERLWLWTTADIGTLPNHQFYINQNSPNRGLFWFLVMDIQAVTDADIQADPLAVLDLCIEVLEESTDAITPTGRANPVKTVTSNNDNSEMAEIRKKYEGTDKWMVAPNGQPTRLNESQWLQVRTSSFKSWFGDWEGGGNSSKAIDANGEPLVLYHGTHQAEIKSFNRRFKVDHLRDKDGVDSIGSWFSDNKEKAVLLYGKAVYEVFVSLKNPIIYNDWDELMEDWVDAHSGREARKKANKDAMARFNKNNHWGGSDLYREWNFGGAHDGFILKANGRKDSEWEDQTAYVVAEPNQVKSAVGNTGSFNADSPIIYDDISGLCDLMFDSIGSELDAITDQDIQADPLAVLDLCIEVLEESTDAITPTGRTNPVKTAKGTKIGTQFAVVEVEKLITSHDSAGNENPAFPQELQPRDRSRDASRAWVAKTANSLDNDSLGRTSRADSGAPIVGRDGIVESGNGRTMAIRMAYDQGTADEYRQFLIDEADYFGIDPDQVERMKRPVLVRVRTTDIDRRVFTVEANQDDKLALSATERARSDSKRLDDKLLAIFAPGEDGDLNTAANQRFIQGFLKSIGDNEAAQYMTTDGKPTKGLIDRIQAAIFSKAYNDDRLLEMMADQTKTEIKNVISALNSAAPKFIESQAYSRLGTEAVSEQVVDGIEQSLDQRVIDAVIEATNTLLAAKAKNQDITEYVTQGGLFEDIDEGVAALAVFLSQNARNPKRIGIAFKAMAEFVKTDAIDQTNVGLFGDPVPPSMVDVVAAANREIQRIYGDDDDKTIGLFDDPVEPEPVTETKTVTVKVPISVNLINEATSAAWSGLEKLNDDAFLKVWKNLKAADYMRRRSIRPTGERKSNQHILNQAASGDVQKMVDSEVAKRGFEKKYTLFIEQKDTSAFDSATEGLFDSVQATDFVDSWFDGRIVRWTGDSQSEQAMPLPSSYKIGDMIKVGLYDKGQTVEITGQIRAIKFRSGKVCYEVALPILHTSFAAVVEFDSESIASNGFDSFLADGRYDHIHLDDLQMHPYANAAKERQPTAKTPLLVQKNRRGDLYLIAGVKRYEMALDDDLEYLPAVILPVVEGYGDPVIKRVLNAYTGSIDPLALMAAIEDAVIERAGKKVIR